MSSGPSHRDGSSDSLAAPAVPTPDSRAVHRPVDIRDVQIGGGPLGQWQQRNREASLPLATKRLEEAGNLLNVRLAARVAEGEYRTPLFMDSDIYKTLEAIGWEAGRKSEGSTPTGENGDADDKSLREFVSEAVELLARAQGADGYLNSYYQVVEPSERYKHLEFSHEMYCAGHLIQAAVALARAAGDDRLLNIARRFADHFVEVFLHGGNDGIDGHPEIETALVELYRLTKETSYLELARKLVDNRGYGRIGKWHSSLAYLQDHQPVREAETLAGHAVRALYLESGIVDVYLETGEESLLDTSIRRFEDMIATKTAITGGLGSRHSRESFGDRYELPPDRAYNETCAAIANIHWCWRLLLATGEARYADLIERSLYNVFAASTSVDGTRFFYVNPLQRRFDHIEGDDPGRRHEWFSCACCPPNIMRLVASFGAYTATTTDDGVFLHQYLPGRMRAALPAGAVELEIDTDYPWSGEVRVTVRRAPGGAFDLAFRRPAWGVRADLTVGGDAGDEGVGAAGNTPDQHGYLRVRRAWKPGDTVTLRLDMTPRIVYPHPRIDALRGCAAIERGPLVYCFEQVDQRIDVEELRLPPEAALRALDEPDRPGIGRTVTIGLEAQQVTHPTPSGLPYMAIRPAPAGRRRQVTATAIPYFQWDNRDGGPMRVWLPVPEDR